jgi:hypothetical protein
VIHAEERLPRANRNGLIASYAAWTAGSSPALRGIYSCQIPRALSAPLRVSLWRPSGYFFFGFGLCFAWASADAIGPRSFFGVPLSRRSLPACEASFFDVTIRFLSRLVLRRRAVDRAADCAANRMAYSPKTSAKHRAVSDHAVAHRSAHRRRSKRA